MPFGCLYSYRINAAGEPFDTLFIGSSIARSDRHSRAAAIAHELDHALSYRKPRHAYRPESAARKVLEERSAYEVSRAVLAAGGNVHPDASYQAIREITEQAQSPEDAAAQIATHGRKLVRGLRKHQHPSFGATSSAIPAHAAQVFTEMYASHQSEPTRNEIAAYAHLGLIQDSLDG